MCDMMKSDIVNILTIYDMMKSVVKLQQMLLCYSTFWNNISQCIAWFHFKLVKPNYFAKSKVLCFLE